MEKVKYKESFKTLVEKSTDTVYIGRGNSNAEVLIVGTECTRDNDFFARNWKTRIQSNQDVNSYWVYENKEKEGHTWNKYQKLHNYIFGFENDKKNFNHEMRMFNTEMSEISNKNISDAKKNPEFEQKLKHRKATFFTSDFVQQFPVVILACPSAYIENVDKKEINDIFCVTFDKEYSVWNKRKTREYKFWTHYNTDKTKLVVNTRQLSGDVPDNLLQEIGALIQDFILPKK